MAPTSLHDDLSARLAALQGMPSAPTNTTTTTMLRPLREPPREPTRQDILADRLRALRSEAAASPPEHEHEHAARSLPHASRGDSQGGPQHDSAPKPDNDNEAATDLYGQHSPDWDPSEDAPITEAECIEELFARGDNETPSWLEEEEVLGNRPEDKPPDGPRDYVQQARDLSGEPDLADALSGLRLDSSFPDVPSRTPLHLPSAPSSVPFPSLPSVPRTKPHKRLGTTSRARYTDSDAHTWCIVCLDDATLKCLDCDDGQDMYCSRDWHDMHVGPSAGAGDGEHRAVAYARDKTKPNKVLLGA